MADDFQMKMLELMVEYKVSQDQRGNSFYFTGVQSNRMGTLKTKINDSVALYGKKVIITTYGNNIIVDEGN